MSDPLDFLNNVTPEPEPPPVKPDFRASEDRPPQNGRRSRGAEPKPRKTVPAYRPGEVKEAMLKAYRGVAFAVMPFKPSVAITLMAPVAEPTEENPTPISVAENCAEAWEAAAKVYPWVRQMLEGGEKIAVIVGLVVAHAPIIAAAVEGTPVAEKLNPAAAMEAFLKRREAAKEAPSE